MSDYLRILLTGATGDMGEKTLASLLAEKNFKLTVFSLDTKKDRKILAPYQKDYSFDVFYGDLSCYEDVENAVKDVDCIVHLAGLVSPMADKYPELAMRVNHGSIVNIIHAIKKLKKDDSTYLISIGTVAQTGDRRPPIHWGRVQDAMKPSIGDYYAVSKVAAEREVIESYLPHWVSLRQTGIMGKGMVRNATSPIILHNPPDNVLEYVSDRDSAILIRNICHRIEDGSLKHSDFWQNVYNIGGGESCRADTMHFYRIAFEKMGVDSLEDLIDPKIFASRNFHGHYYYDSDKLEERFHFRHDGLEYFSESFSETLGVWGKLARLITKIPGGKSLLSYAVRQFFKQVAKGKGGSLRMLKEKNEDFIEAFWGGIENWKKIPDTISQELIDRTKEKGKEFDYGYSLTQAKEKLDFADLKEAIRFRGGTLLSDGMETGDWSSKHRIICPFGHHFEASAKLILGAGHWCPVCENHSWNYDARAKVEPFFRQFVHGYEENGKHNKSVEFLKRVQAKTSY